MTYFSNGKINKAAFDYFDCTNPKNDAKDTKEKGSKACAVTNDAFLNHSKWNILLDG